MLLDSFDGGYFFYLGLRCWRVLDQCCLEDSRSVGMAHLFRCDGWYWTRAPKLLLLLQVSCYFAPFCSRMLSLVWKKNGYHWALSWITSSGLTKIILKKTTRHVPMIEQGEIYIRWRDGSATPKAQSHSVLTRLCFHEWKSRAEMPSWRWAKIAILSRSPLACPCRTIGLPGGEGGANAFSCHWWKRKLF